MQNLAVKTIREIAVESPVTTRVFEEFKIDYCCHGNTLFDEACRNAGASPDVVSQKIDHVLSVNHRPRLSFTAMSPTELVDHILEHHHVYTKQEMEQLTPLMEKVSRKHGEHYPYLDELKEVFKAVCDDLAPHRRRLWYFQSRSRPPGRAACRRCSGRQRDREADRRIRPGSHARPEARSVRSAFG